MPEPVLVMLCPAPEIVLVNDTVPPPGAVRFVRAIFTEGARQRNRAGKDVGAAGIRASQGAVAAIAGIDGQVVGEGHPSPGSAGPAEQQGCGGRCRAAVSDVIKRSGIPRRGIHPDHAGVNIGLTHIGVCPIQDESAGAALD